MSTEKQTNLTGVTTRQHLINIHGVGAPTEDGLKKKEFKNGEIAVQHGETEATSAIHILNNGQSKLVTFLPKGQDKTYAKQTDLNSLTSRVTTAEKEITDNAQTSSRGITENKKAIAENTKAIGANTASISDHEGRLHTAETEIDALQAKKMVDSFGGQTGAITLDTDASADKTVRFSMSGNELQGTVNITIPGHQAAAKTVTLTGDVTGSATAEEAGATLTIATEIQENAITTTELANDAVETANIKDAQVTSAKLGAGSVITEKIEDLNVTTGKINNLAVTTGKIADLNVTTVKIADNAVTDAKIDTVSATKVKFATAAGDNADVAIKALQDAVSGGSHFIGVTETAIKNGDAATSKIVTDIHKAPGKLPEVGDFVIYKEKEFIASGNPLNWVELGDTSAERTDINTLTGYFGDDAILDVVHGGTGASDLAKVTVGNASTAANATKAYDKNIDELSTYVLGKTSGSGKGDFINSVSLSNGKLTAATGSFSGITAGKATDASYASHVGTSTSHPQIGSGVNPVYVNSDGVVTASASTVGDDSHVMYLKDGVLTQGNALPTIPSITINGNNDTEGMVIASANASGHIITLTEQAVVYNETPVNFATMTIDCGKY